MEQTRTSKDIAAEKAKLIAEAEQLQTRSATEQLTEEEEARLEACITQAEALEPELLKQRRAERIAEQKVRLEQPTRPAPRAPSVPAQYRSDTVSQAEGLQLWLKSFTEEADLSTDAHYRSRLAGFQIGASTVRMRCDYGGTLNRHYRYLAKSAAGHGAELIPTTYSDKVVEYLTYFSPILNVLNSETTADANARVYFKFDDTALIANYNTASGGTEIAPTIPDVDVSTAGATIAAFDINSGYHKLTYQILRDSPHRLEDKVARAISNSFARFMEKEILTAAGDGSTGIQGVTTACTSAGTPAAWDEAAVESLVYSVPQQYRAGSVLLASPTTKAEIRSALVDTTGRSLFDSNVADGVEYDMLKGFKFFESTWVPDDVLYFFQPNFYMLRLVEGQQLQVLKEKFAPHIAYLGLMAIGGAYLGPAATAKKLTLTA